MNTMQKAQAKTFALGRSGTIFFCLVVASAYVGVKVVAANSVAPPSQDQGQLKFGVCAPCHGGDGRSGALPEYPKIAGQNRKYIVNALQAYKNGRRTGTYAALMAETAKNLSDADIENLAVYISGLDDSK